MVKFTLATKFWAKVNKDGPVPQHCPELGPCWLWTAALSAGRYGEIKVGGVNKKATHVACLLETGLWPLQNMLHICDNTFCVRFSHLFEGTQQDNINDMLAKGRAADKYGELNPKAKITTKQAQQIRTLYATGEYTTRGLAKQFGLASKSSIGSILKGKSW